METRNERLTPFIAVHPGNILKEELKARGIIQKDFAGRIGMQPSHLSELLRGKRGINAETAQKLEVSLGIPAKQWLALQNSYELDCSAISERNEREQKASVTEAALTGLCNIKELYKRLRVSADAFAEEKMDALRQAFGEEPLAFAYGVPRGAFKRSDKLEVDEKNLLTWLMLAVAAIKSDKPKGDYEHGDAEAAAREIAIRTNMGGVTEGAIREILNDHGISYSVVQKLDKVPVDAYSTNALGYPAIVVTHRHDDMARLVFNVLHELGHIHLHLSDGKEVFWTMGDSYSSKDPQETEANTFAEDMLISRKKWHEIINGAAGSIKPASIITYLRKEAKARGLNFGAVTWRYRYETQNYALGLKAQKIVY